MAWRALIFATIALAASASHGIAGAQRVSCQLSGLAIGPVSSERINKTLLFHFDDSSRQLISENNGVLATTLGYSDREIVGRLKDVALTGDAPPSLFGSQLEQLDASQANFFVDRVYGSAFFSATFLSKGAAFAVGPCGPIVPQSMPSRGRYGAERD